MTACRLKNPWLFHLCWKYTLEKVDTIWGRPSCAEYILRERLESFRIGVKIGRCEVSFRHGSITAASEMRGGVGVAVRTRGAHLIFAMR